MVQAAAQSLSSTERSMSSNRNGQVVTFYSYKGGTGRTMALANVAWILAANGKRVLTVDWDLESPGLFRFFSPFISPNALASTGGVIELIRKYEWARNPASREGRDPEFHARVNNFSFSLNWDHFPEGATLDFLSAGQQMLNYAPTLAGMNWDDFYEHQEGGRFLDALRADMKREYDYTLIDSRTGHSDIADICTIQLPDILVDCFTLSNQGIEGAAQVALKVNRHAKREIRVLPVPMRIDSAEKLKAESGRIVAMQRFEGFPTGLSDVERQAYWAALQVPHQAFYGYEETLATFADTPGSTGTLLHAYEMLTSHITQGEITSLPPMDESARAPINVRFLRRPTLVEDEIVLRYASQDSVWAEWIEAVLEAVGITVFLSSGETSEPEALPVNARTMTIVSNANIQRESSFTTTDIIAGRPPLAVYISDVGRLPGVSQGNSANIVGQSASVAVERILAILGRSAADIDSALASGPRYAGDENQIFNVPVRNTNFTGREADLHRLRRHLRARSAVVLSGTQPVALQGMGGIGKTQLAIEYAHRFHTAYDVVWWMSAESVSDTEAQLVELGQRLGFHIEVTGPEAAKAVVAALSRIKQRWLLIMDNAEDPDAIGQYIPQGTGGHVLLTSRNPSWGERAQPVPVEVFQRRESVEHLRQRIPSIRPEAADQIAGLLADLPIAIAAAGAWLADTGTDIDEYLRFIHQEGPSAVLERADDPVQKTWDLSLRRLYDRSPAAYRLFQLCCVLGPEISLDLVYSDELAELLRPIDPSVTERMVRGSLVQRINRLALLRVDPRGDSGGQRDRPKGQVLIHRVVQDVVRSRMTEDELAQAKIDVQRVLAAARPRGEVDEPENWPVFRSLWPHLDVSDAMHSTKEAVRALIVDRVRYQWLQGDLLAGKERAERTAEAWKEMLAEMEDSPDRIALQRQLLRLQFNLANIMRDLGLFKDSLRLDEEVLAAQRELLGDIHPHTLMTIGSLAADLRGLGRYPEALARDSANFEAWKENYGEDHQRTLAALNNLAVCDRLMGNFHSARERDEQVHQSRRLILGETNLFTLASAACVARDVRDAGDYERSADLLRNLFRACVDSRGPQSRAALTAQSNLAISLRSSGQIDLAVQYHDEAYDALNELLGPTNPETLSCRLSLALSHLAVGDADRSQRELVGVVEIYRTHLGDKHPHTLICLANLAMAERKREENDIAFAHATEAVDGLTEVLGTTHPYTLSTRMNLAICVAERGDLQGALEIFQETATAMDPVLGPEHPNTLRCLANLALVMNEMGHPGAVDQIAEIHERLVRRLNSTSHPIVEGLRKRHYLYRIIDPHPF